MKHVLALTLAAMAAGCSSNAAGGNHGATNAPAGASTTASTAAAAPVEAGAPGAPALDVYPGATKLATQMHGSMTFCGTKMTTVVYHVKDANAQTVAAWYSSHIPGAISIKVPAQDQSVVEVFEPGGHAAAAISQIHFNPQLASAAKGLGADRVILGLETFDPPVSSDTIDMVRSAANGDATASATMKARCAETGD